MKKNLLLLLFSALMLLNGCSKAKKNHQRPNIVFIMSDDHGYQAISAYQDDLIKTPNIDRIANGGITFKRATVTNSLCAPSRAVMLTGKHSFVNGKVDNVQGFDWNQNSFPKMLQAAGYKTALFGKIHLDGIPQGFDNSAVLPGQGHYYNPEFIINEDTSRISGYVSDIITDLSLEWLNRVKDEDAPFCLLYHHKAPHREWMPPKRYFKEYIHKKFPEPATLFDDYKGRGTAARVAEMNILRDMNWAWDSKIYPDVMDELGIKETLSWDNEAFENNTGRMSSQQMEAWNETYRPMNQIFKKEYPQMDSTQLMKWRYQRYMQDYLACIACVDENVGRVLDFLEENGLAENTIVVYTSDQGFFWVNMDGSTSVLCTKSLSGHL